MDLTTTAKPSKWVTQYSYLLPHSGPILDIASGGGRHTCYLLKKGHTVVAVDKNISPLQGMKTPLLFPVQVDLEADAPWPFKPGSFSGIIVTNYLYRPLFENIIDGLEKDGVLIYETFAKGNEKFGKPHNPDYLLKPGELIRFTLDKLHILAYEDLTIAWPKPARLQRICAKKSTTIC